MTDLSDEARVGLKIKFQEVREFVQEIPAEQFNMSVYVPGNWLAECGCVRLCPRVSANPV